MATASTQKKIERVQRAGVKRRAGQRRPLGFPALVIGIVVVGTVLVLLARDARNAVTVTRPTTEDQWYAAFGVYVCGEWLPAGDITDVTKSTGGIQANGDGLISIRPTSTKTAGKNAVIGQFFKAVGIDIDNTGWTHTPVNGSPDSHRKGDACDPDGEGGKEPTTKTSPRLLVFPPQASDKTEPDVLVDNFATERFKEDGKTYVLALLPDDADPNDVPLPPSVKALENPNGTPPGVPAKQGDTSTTTAAPASTTTAGGESTTTSAAGTSAPTTTAAGAATTTTAG